MDAAPRPRVGSALDFSGKSVFVAGGSSGIGLGIAGRFCEAFEYCALDVSDDAAVRQVVSRIDSLDVLVCSVGTVAYGRAEYDIEVFRRIIDVNLNGVMHLCTLFEAQLRRSQGSVVLIGSTSSFVATPGQPAYGASKGALVTLMRSLARAWASKRIRVNGVAPGMVKTKLTTPSYEDPNVYEKTLARIPLGRWVMPQEVGDAVLFLASPMAASITGQMLLVDGGQTLM